jgi:hypothetical protein
MHGEAKNIHGRKSHIFGPALTLHLGVVFSLFIIIRYGKFVHGIVMRRSGGKRGILSQTNSRHSGTRVFAWTADVQLHIGESRDSGFEASPRPGMTV